MKLIEGTSFWYYRRDNTFYIFGPSTNTKSLIYFTVKIIEEGDGNSTVIMNKYVKTTKTGFRKRLTPKSLPLIMHDIVGGVATGQLDILPSFISEVIKKEIYG